MNGLILFVYLTQVCLCTQCYICIAQNSSLRAWTLRCYAGGAALIARGILSNIRSSLCTSLECVVMKTLSNYKDVIRYVCISSCKIRKWFRPCSFTWYCASISWNICKKDYASSRSHIRKGTIYVCFKYMYVLSDLIIFQDIHWLSPHSYNIFNTLRPRQNDHYITHDVFKSIFVNENLSILIKISL